MSRLTEGMKHRLIGAVVLGCLAIIFIPILLDGEGLGDPGLARVIPPPPPLPALPDIEPRRPLIEADRDPPAAVVEAPPLSIPPADVAVAPPAEPLPEPVAEPVQDPAPALSPPAVPQPTLDARGLPEAWQVRLATFAEPGNAQALVGRLLDAGHKAYSRPIASPQGTLTAVYVGPVLSRAEADTLRSALRQSFSLDGLVVSFTIDTPPKR